MANEKIFIYGKHAVGEALANAPQAVEQLILADTAIEPSLIEQAKKLKIQVSRFQLSNPPKGVDPNVAHQGVMAAMIVNKLVKGYGEFISQLDINKNTCLVILGEIQDPQNVGAIIRSAAAFGVAGILLPEHNQAPISGTVVKVSAGMAFHLPLVEIGNINNTIRDLKDKGFWIYGLDEKATQPLAQEKFQAPTVFVLGNEARGMREKTRETCDIVLKIPMNPGCESLNVAATSAVALYSWSVHHQGALGGK